MFLIILFNIIIIILILGTVLSALQIIGTAEFSSTSERRLKISYDVYIPKIPLKKSSRGLPNYRLVIVE